MLLLDGDRIDRADFGVSGSVCTPPMSSINLTVSSRSRMNIEQAPISSAPSRLRRSPYACASQASLNP